MSDETVEDSPSPQPAPPAPAPVAPPRPDRRKVALLVWLLCVIVYGAFSNDRLRVHSPDNHFAYLADSWLHGQMSVRCDEDIARHVACPPGNGGNDWARYQRKWFVAFPAFPAAVYLPAVAILGRDFPNRAWDVILAGVAPALLYLLLEELVRRGHSKRPWRENLALAVLFAFGTVFFFSAVQGSVWFTAHVIGCALMAGYLYYALDTKNAWAAGALCGLMFHTRTPMLLASIVFGIEALRVNRRPNEAPLKEDPDLIDRAVHGLKGVDWPAALKAVAKFCVPLVVFAGVYMAMNKARFGDWGDPGYRHLQIRWSARIGRWGLFNFHYLSRNLAVALALLPWVSRVQPFVQVSRHGLALWVTTPQYLELARPARSSVLSWSLGLAAFAIALIDLLYQNSGWVQFGYRFSNDFAVLLIVLLALTGRPIRRIGWALLAVAIAVNAFGAATFERPNQVYQGDNDAQGMFQPD